MNTPTDTKTSSFPKFPDLDSLIKELVSLRSIRDSTEQRIEIILSTLKEAKQQLEHSLSDNFSPPPSSDADIQKAMSSLSTLVKSSATALGNQTNGSGKMSPDLISAK